MKAVFTLLANRVLAGAGGRKRPANWVFTAHEKPSHTRSAEGLRHIWIVRALLLAQIAIFLALVTIHFGLLVGGYEHAAAATTELVIAVVLVFGFLLTSRPPPWSQRVATAAQSFGMLGVLVGLLTITVGTRPRTVLDLSLNLVLLLALIAGLARGRRPAGQV